MTVERIHQAAANLSTRISGSLLGVSTALQNRMQEFLGGIIEMMPNVEFKGYYSINKIPYLKNPKSPLSIPYTANYHLL